ncbi:hypothetical protein [Hyphomicrobium sp. DY-1]|uniref:hypothetical protein n=1 Tax=Hyphomicrobium sp. DY-1 TaxID=3075650 RepID=UPI0039C27E59
MKIPRLFPTLVLSAALSLSGAQAGIAQSLSDAASLALTGGWSTGYMGLGGNLGRAMEHRQRHHHQAKAVRSAKSSRTAHRATHRQAASVQPASYQPKRRDTPTYLIAQALDQSGLTVNTLRLQHFP